jgi:uncharacterized membrane protein YdbT with pleckstrin-like domain
MLSMQKLDPKAKWNFFFIFLGRSLTPLGFLVGFWFFDAINPNLQSVEPMTTIITITPLLILAILLFCWLWSGLSYTNYNYELKDEGVRIERGVIWKKYVTIPYDRIQNVDILRGLVARILGLSDLQIQTAGGLTSANYGAYSEGRLPGLSPHIAENLRDEVLKVSRKSRHHTDQGGI